MVKLRHILHIDMDAFFASVEQMDNPKLLGRPLIVGGNPQGRGVVAACSYEARKYGIHSAMSASHALRLCPQAVFVRPRKDRYQEISSFIMDIFRESAPLVEPLSLDEAFLDISGIHENLSDAGQMADSIRRRIFEEIGLTSSAGLSHNKFLAKAASDINKPNGMTIITPEETVDFLSTLPISRFYGVGRITEKKMHQLGVQAGADLLRFSREELSSFFGKAGLFFHDIVRGIDNRPVTADRNRKSIGTESTFQQDIVELSELTAILCDLSRKVAFGLQKKNITATTITLKIRYYDFDTVTRSITLPIPIYSADEISKHLPILLRSTEAGRKPVRLLGITVSNLSSRSSMPPRQMPLPFK